MATRRTPPPDPIGRAVTKAVARAISALKKREPHVTGFALCTNSNVNGLFPIATNEPREHVDWALPNEWKVRVPGKAREGFDKIGDSLSLRLDGTRDVGQHVRRSFECLVEALSELRASGKVGDDVLLLVVDVDPTPLTERLCAASARRLNSPAIFRYWHSDFFGKPAAR